MNKMSLIRPKVSYREMKIGLQNLIDNIFFRKRYFVQLKMENEFLNIIKK